MDKNFDVKSFSFGEEKTVLDEERKFYDGVESLERQKQKGKLFDDGSLVLGKVARQKKVYISLGKYGKKFMNLTVKETFKDYKSSIKKVDKQIPACVELPTYEKESKESYSVKSGRDGQKEFVFPKKKEKETKQMKKSVIAEVLDFTQEESRGNEEK